MMEVSPLPCFAVRKIQEQVARCKTIPVNVVSVPEFSILFREREGVSSQFFCCIYTRNTFIVRNIFYL